MANAAGLVIRLSPDRQEIFEFDIYGGFSEPVNDFLHSRNLPLICFVFDSNSRLIHVAQGRKGNRAGTDLRRLHLEDAVAVLERITVEQIINEAPARFKQKLKEKLKNGGLLPPRTFEVFIQILCSLVPKLATLLARYSEERRKRIANLPERSRAALAEQKEAVATAMAIAQIDRDGLQFWDIAEGAEISSYLDGLDRVRLREDQMVVHDLTTLPGFDEVKSSQYGSVVFENDNSKLTVLLANRLELEKLLGVDLIYFNETFSCFLMIQYKAMEKEGRENVFRFPNKQLDDELKRMHGILKELEKCATNTVADGFRLLENPFFLKVCPRISFNPDDTSLVKGMYLPLDYWNLISNHPSMIGPKGGKKLSYSNVRRYFDNTEFINIASGAWVGTNIDQSSVVQAAVRSTLESGRAVVLAVSTNRDTRHRIDDQSE